jgi:RHS repeat-associated protein
MEAMRRVPTIIALFLWPAALLAQDVQYYHLDAIGNVRAVTNQSGAVVERHDYLPFGEECTTGACASNSGITGGQPKHFTGKERDTETGLDYFGARYYHARVARFTTIDPVYTTAESLLDPQRWNRYAYARANPLRYVDPDGRLTIIVPGTWSRGVIIRSKNTEWAQPGTPFNRAVSETFGEPAQVVEWPSDNNKGARKTGAEWLQERIEAHTFDEGESLNIVAHSHGGNVVKAYTHRPGARKIATLVTLGTPQRDDASVDPSKVGKYINLYTLEDDTQVEGGPWGFLTGRQDPAAQNIDATGVAHGHGDLHTERVWNSEVRDKVVQ